MKTLVLINFFILALMSYSACFGSVVFEDDFSNGDILNRWINEKWSRSGLNDWSIENASLKGDIPRNQYSYLMVKIGITLSDFIFDSSVVSVRGVDTIFVFRASENLSNYYQVDYKFYDSNWTQDCNKITLRKIINGNSSLLRTVYSNQFTPALSLTKNVLHNTKIVVSGNNIKAYFDNVLVIDYIDNNNPISGGRLGLLNWSGDYASGNVVNFFDDIKISSSNHANNKVIIIPGMGGSWNTEAMVLNNTVADDKWKMTPFVHNYDNLISLFESNGYVKGSNLLVWNYDWRRPVSEIVGKFDNFVNSNIGSSEKVDIVGHSLGGLTARLWAQDHIDDSRLNKVITLGSPHQGSVNAYEAYSGAKLNTNSPSGLALKILLQLQRENGFSEVETIRRYSPSLKDILPTFDFVKKNGNIIGVNSLETVNDYLIGKNLIISEIFNNLLAIVGKNNETKEWLRLGERGLFEKRLGYWPDGKVLSSSNGDGDGTVPLKSAKFIDDPYIELDSNHGEIPDKAINTVIGELGLSNIGTSKVNIYDLDNKLVFYLGSPAFLNINCGGSEYVSDEMGFAFIDNQNLLDCRVNVVGTDNGEYHLVAGKVGDDNWSYFEDNIQIGQTDTYIWDGSNNEMKNSVDNKNRLWSLVGEDNNKLKEGFGNLSKLVELTNNINNKNINNCINNVFSFRKDKKEDVISFRMIDSLMKLLAIENGSITKNQAESMRKKVMERKSLVDGVARLYIQNKLNTDDFRSETYIKVENLVNDINSDWNKNNFADVWSKSMVAEKMLREIF